jgi:signal transduction histidine kinase
VPVRRADLLVGLAGGALGAIAGALDGVGGGGLVAGAVIGGSLGAARGQPRIAWMVAVAALLAWAPYASPTFGLLLLVAAHAFCAGRWQSPKAGLAALGALVSALELGLVLAHDSGGVPALLLPAAGWGAGRALRERELVAAELAERARELEQEREAHAALCVRYERARIASELHDIVAHALSVMVVQASAGQRLARDPEAVAATFAAIAGAARQAEGDMGRLVALLGDEAAVGHAPDFALVEELVARAAGSGLDVRLRLEGEREGLPAGVAECAYHVVQEGLTNALRHAAGAAIRVRVRGDREALVIEVTNAPAEREPALAGVGTGTGLRGLRERAAACGGTLEAGPTRDGGWRLGARLPRRVAAGTS